MRRGWPRSSTVIMHAAAGTSSNAELLGGIARVSGPDDVLAARVGARSMVLDVEVEVAAVVQVPVDATL